MYTQKRNSNIYRLGAILLAVLLMASSSMASAAEIKGKKTAKSTETTVSSFTGNKGVIYEYLTESMGLNHAAACGVLANIEMESNFDPNISGDYGTSYGICQWHNGRYQNLIAWCENAGLDYQSMEAQLEYLSYELANLYPDVLAYLQSVDDSSEGAYNAAYYWCMYYESPGDAEYHSEQRGSLAVGEYY